MQQKDVQNIGVEGELIELLRAVEGAMQDRDGSFSEFQSIQSKVKSLIVTVKHIEDISKLFSDRKYEALTLMEDISRHRKKIKRKSLIMGTCCYCFKEAYYHRKELKGLSSSLDRLSALIQEQETSRPLNISLIPRCPNGDGEDEGIKDENLYTKLLPDQIVGFDSLLGDIKKELFIAQQSVVVLSAPGGYGKTTLAKMFCQDQSVKDIFRNDIFFVAFTKMANLKVIVKQILEQKSYKVPKFQSDEHAINYLEEKLQQQGQDPILLVLDDVWSGSEVILEKLKFQMSNYKILVTSRSEFPSLGSTYKLTALSKEDADTLFHLSAFSSNGSSYEKREILPAKRDDFLDQDQVVEACNGLPLALTVVGKSFYKQDKAVYIYREMEKKRKNAGSVVNLNANPLNCIRSCLEVLEHKTKECYLDLGSFPEGQLIPVTALIDMWVELYDLDEHGISISILNELTTIDLVNLVMREDANDADGCYGGHFVMQHDVLRELVIDVNKFVPVDKRKRLTLEISGNEFPEEWAELTQQPICAHTLSVSTDESFSSDWKDMQIPEVKVVVLNLLAATYKLPEFLETAKELRALIVTNYGFLPAEIINFQILQCLTNLKRIRLEQVFVSSLSFETGQLLCLQKISLVRCDMGQFFNNISDSMPNLVEIAVDYCHDLVTFLPAICGIVRLKKLSITYCKDLSSLPEEFANLVNLEVLRVRSCTRLRQLPDVIGNLQKLSILDISYCSCLRKLPEQIRELVNLSKLYMSACPVVKLPHSIRNLEQLKFVECDNQVAQLLKSFGLPNLVIKIKY